MDRLFVAGLALAWESIWRPSKDRRALEAGLAAEINEAIRYLASHRDMGPRQRPRAVPPDFKISTIIFRAVAPRLGTLEPTTLAKLVALYRQFEELNWTPREFQRLSRAVRTARSQPECNDAEDEVELCFGTFYEYLITVQALAEQTLPLLRSTASPTASLPPRDLGSRAD